jgi:hypothetical protein
MAAEHLSHTFQRLQRRSLRVTYYAGMDRWACPDLEIMKSLFDNTNLWWCGFYLGPRYNYMDKYDALRKIGWGIAPIYWGRMPAGYCAGVKKHFVDTNHPRAKTFDVERCRALQQVPKEAFAKGKEEGISAAGLAASAGIPRGSILYLDCEMPHDDPQWFDYFAGWVHGVVSRGYRTGLYCSYLLPDTLFLHLAKRPALYPAETIPPVIWGMRNNGVKNVKKAGDPRTGKSPQAPPIKAPFPEPNPAASWRGAALWQHALNVTIQWTENGATRSEFVDLNSSIYRDPSQGPLSNISYATKEFLKLNRENLKPAWQQSGQFTKEFKAAHGM